MALLERVSTLLRANVNDLLNKAEDPENSLASCFSTWKSVDAGQDSGRHCDRRSASTGQEEDRAGRTAGTMGAQSGTRRIQATGRSGKGRACLLFHLRLAEGFAEQYVDQTGEADTLRTAYSMLQLKLEETRSQVELLIIQHRRNRAMLKANTARGLAGGDAVIKLARISAKVQQGEAQSQAARTLLSVTMGGSLDERFAELEQNDEIEALLLELKERQPRLT